LSQWQIGFVPGMVQADTSPARYSLRPTNQRVDEGRRRFPKLPAIVARALQRREPACEGDDDPRQRLQATIAAVAAVFPSMAPTYQGGTLD
jgi:hypothetical protein